MEKNTNANVSIIIRCKNEEQWIGHCIQSVLDLIYKPEIIVIDNKSTDDSMLIVKSFMEDPLLEGTDSSYTKIKIVSIDDYTPGKALNMGVSYATMDYILVISSHCVLTHINILKMESMFKDNIALSVIFGNQNPRYFGKKIKKRYLWSNFGKSAKYNYFSKYENRYFIHNALAFYSRNTLFDYLFDEHLISKEDRYWINNMIYKNYCSYYDPKFSCDHHYTDNGASWKGIG